jgi:hypothetical protein
LKEVDIDNFLTYYAVQIYVANGDWPGNNIAVYRYAGTQNPVYNDNDGTIGTGAGTTDGRWRWLLYDTDFGFGLYNNPVENDTLGMVLGKTPVRDQIVKSDLLVSVLTREDMRQKFAGIFYDLMNHAYSQINVYNIIDAREAERKTALEYNYQYGDQLIHSWSSMDSVSSEIDMIRRYASARAGQVRGKIRQYLGIGGNGSFLVNIKHNDNAAVRFNTCDVNDFDRNFSGRYFNEGSFPLSVTVKDGYEFEYYLINGKKFYTPEMMITADFSENAKVDISAVVSPKKTNLAPLVEMIDYENADDSITLKNPYALPINLSGLYISEDPEDPFRAALPDKTIEPGGEIVIYCKNSSSVEALGQFFVDFNLKSGETLTITNSEHMTVASVFLPELDREYIYCRSSDGFGGYHAAIKSAK